MSKQFVKVKIYTTDKGKRCGKRCKWNWGNRELFSDLLEYDNQRRGALRCEECKKAEA